MNIYMGERDRADGRLLADALIDVFARERVGTSVLLRGVEGFGVKHRLQSERLLSLSEDLPLVAVALDTRPRIEALLTQVRALSPYGVITLERARLLSGRVLETDLPPGQDAAKLTVHLARRRRVEGGPAYVAVVECLRRHGVAGASVLLGVDGTAVGVRRRARFFAGNAEVPLMVQSVGERARIATALAEISTLLDGPTMTLERARVCKRDGVLLAEPQRLPPVDEAGRQYWQKLVVYAGEQTRHQHQPLHAALIERLRREGAAGATALRGQWGYHGDHLPHGERFWSLRRHVPMLTVILDTPANTLRWFEIVDEMTGETGLVTSEIVPALRAGAPDYEHGGLRLAQPRSTGGASERERG
jgi:PII-like signaling protein